MARKYDRWIKETPDGAPGPTTQSAIDCFNKGLTLTQIGDLIDADYRKVRDQLRKYIADLGYKPPKQTHALSPGQVGYDIADYSRLIDSFHKRTDSGGNLAGYFMRPTRKKSAFEYAATKHQRWTDIEWIEVLSQPAGTPVNLLITIQNKNRIDRVRQETARKRMNQTRKTWIDEDGKKHTDIIRIFDVSLEEFRTPDKGDIFYKDEARATSAKFHQEDEDDDNPGAYRIEFGTEYEPDPAQKYKIDKARLGPMERTLEDAEIRKALGAQISGTGTPQEGRGQVVPYREKEKAGITYIFPGPILRMAWGFILPGGVLATSARPSLPYWRAVPVPRAGWSDPGLLFAYHRQRESERAARSWMEADSDRIFFSFTDGRWCRVFIKRENPLAAKEAPQQEARSAPLTGVPWRWCYMGEWKETTIPAWSRKSNCLLRSSRCKETNNA